MTRRFHAVFACLLALMLVLGSVCLPSPVLAADGANELLLDGRVNRNVSTNTYVKWSYPVHSYLTETADGGYVRVCPLLTDTRNIYWEDQFDGLLAEWYSPAGKLLCSKTLDFPLPLFGGFLFGANANYAIYGQENTNNDENALVLLAVRYDRDMNELGRTPLYGMNTSIPFEAGSCRMLETGGRLYIYTCHEMYSGHQSNMTLVFDPDTMDLVDSFYETANNGYGGYVSHSFNQFIATDGTYIYRADHGDAHPRGLYLSRYSVGGTLGYNSYTVPLTFAGRAGVNSTGATLGGMAIVGQNVLLAGTIDSQSADYDNFYDDSSTEQLNIYVAVAAKSLDPAQNKAVRVTSYAADAGIRVGTPQLVTLPDGALILWEETKNRVTVVRAALLNGNGGVTGTVHTLEARLSDCQPVLCADGTVIWYVSDEERVLNSSGKLESRSDGTNLRLYRLDPANLGAFEPLTHNWQPVEVSVPATCEQDGRANFVCAVCGREKTDVLPATGHNWGDWSFADPEFHTRVCRNDPSHVEREAHTWEIVQVIQEPTCTENGYVERACEICRVRMTDDSLPASHDWGDWTYQDADTHVRICRRDASHTESAPHAWEKTEELRPTAEAEGYIRYQCALCGATKTEILPVVDISFLPGDVDLDGKVAAADARLALRAAVELETYASDSAEFFAADVDRDGVITAGDARTILRAAVGLETL